MRGRKGKDLFSRRARGYARGSFLLPSWRHSAVCFAADAVAPANFLARKPWKSPSRHFLFAQTADYAEFACRVELLLIRQNKMTPKTIDSRLAACAFERPKNDRGVMRISSLSNRAAPVRLRHRQKIYR